MIVYGDPSTQESFASLVERLRMSLSVAVSGSLDAVRSCLIEAGMLEQAVEDGLPERAAGCAQVTDLLAEAFVAFRCERGVRAPRVDGASALLAGFVPTEDRLTVKIPEGFAFYGLYPEAYLEAARSWRRDHPEARKVLVVGVRSIGTTLSAVVAATLRAEGVEARRVTVRPIGHPFRREASLDVEDAEWVLVVDEGPGLSGSSLASVAEAVVRAGVLPNRIAFLPGHGNEPGLQASEATRALWAATPRYVVATEALRWEGRTLEETLAAQAGDAVEIEELTGSPWRERVYRDSADWPAIDAPFERRKILVTRRDGTATLWKFVGLLVPGTTLGFANSPWVKGAPLRREDATPELLGSVARHITATAGPPLSRREAEDARGRLAEMVRWNTQLALGDALLLSVAKDEGSPTCGDDRLGPGEWRYLAKGEIVKIPRPVATGDHTVVGRQPVAWAVAAAIVEWDLDEGGVSMFLAVLRAEGIVISPEALCFYRAAYAAFRLGMTMHCAVSADEEERGRLARAKMRYRAALTAMQAFRA